MKESERSRDLRGITADATLQSINTGMEFLRGILVREFTEEKFIPLYKARIALQIYLAKQRLWYSTSF